MAGGIIRHARPCRRKSTSSNISRAVKHSVPPPSVLILSLSVEPDRPMGGPGTSTRTPIALAKKHDLLVISDVAYGEIYFDNNPPPSVLQVDGRQGHRRRGQLVVEDLRHGRLARGHGGRQ
ncbi:hypothetical protein ACRAWD_27875 [Caulobacter segnis]